MPCRKIACATCVGEGIRKSKEHSLLCPCCTSHHELTDASQFPPVLEVTLKVLGSLLLRCDGPDCSEIVELRKLSEHLESGCRKGVFTYPASKLTLEQVLSRPLTSPPTSVEKKAAAIVLKRMFTEATAGPLSSSIVQLPTAGSVRGVSVCATKCTIFLTYLKPDSLMKVTSPRVASSEASCYTVCRRSNELAQVRAEISGAHLLLSIRMRCGSSPLKRGKHFYHPLTSMPSSHARLLMIPWKKMRIMRR